MRKKLLIGCGCCLALGLVIIASAHIYAQHNPKEYISAVEAADFLLCGSPNICKCL